jgi:hypothetical protein
VRIFGISKNELRNIFNLIYLIKNTVIKKEILPKKYFNEISIFLNLKKEIKKYFNTKIIV